MIKPEHVSDGGSRVSFFRLYGQPLLLLAAVASTVQNFTGGWRDQFSDFGIFYASSMALHRGLDPYTSIRTAGYGPNTNPPLAIWAMLPLTALSFNMASMVWVAIGAVALLWSVYAVHRIIGHGWVILGVILTTEAGILTLRLGQIAWLLIPFATFAWLADRQKRSFAAGCWLGPLVYVKPFYGVYALYLAWRRDRRALTGLALTAAACSLAGLVAGVQTYRSWFATLAGLERQAHVLNGSARGVAARLFNAAVVQPYPTLTALANSRAMEQVTFWSLVIGIAAISAWAVAGADRDRAWAVLGISAVLMSPLGWIYYLPISVGPVACVIVRQKRWAVVWLSTLLLSVPYSLLSMGAYGRLGTVTAGSVFFWATIALWAAMLPGRSVRQPSV